MRAACTILVLLTLGLSAAHAGEEKIPIDVKPMHGVEVTDAQLDWVRAWLRKNLHPDDLAGIVVDLRNRAHPGADYRAEARLTPRDTGTYRVQRVIRFGHRTWRTWALKEEDYDGDWAIDDRDRVQRIFDVDGKPKVMHLSRTLSYEETLAVLKVIAKDGVRFKEDGWDEYKPDFDRVWSIRREDGKIEIRTGGPWSGKWVAGQLHDDVFVVEEQGGYMA